MKKLASLILLMLVAACSPTPTATLLTNPTLLTEIPATTVPQIVPTVIIQPTVAGASAETAGLLWLQILSPLDEAVINTPQVDVIGSTPAGAVLSINEVILIVGIDGQFKTTVPLDEGPNLIEIIASDENGNEMSVLLTVTYEP